MMKRMKKSKIKVAKARDRLIDQYFVKHTYKSYEQGYIRREKTRSDFARKSHKNASARAHLHFIRSRADKEKVIDLASGYPSEETASQFRHPYSVYIYMPAEQARYIERECTVSRFPVQRKKYVTFKRFFVFLEIPIVHPTL